MTLFASVIHNGFRDKIISDKEIKWFEARKTGDMIIGRCKFKFFTRSINDF